MLNEILNHRTLRDLELLFSEDALFWGVLALVSVVGGLAVAWRCFYFPMMAALFEQGRILASLHDKLEVRVDRHEKDITELKALVDSLRGEVVSLKKQESYSISKAASTKADKVVVQPPVPLNFVSNIDEVFKVDRESDEDHVVFILDISKSMTRDEKLAICQKRLKTALRELPESAKFQVIFFSQQARFAHAGDDEEPRWLVADPETIEETIQAIDRIETAYGNEWDLPIIKAMKLDPAPGRIDFLTDGEKTDSSLLATGIVDLVKRAGQKTVINTIALMEPQASPPLYKIAKETAGTHSLVVAKDKVLQDKGDLQSYLESRGIEFSC
ncbi:MAG: VWA domain-containing protein [Verrucomicrobiales bacterium]|nr:VWA domain-containing protein [Verrucomicrobiales bacterium]